MHKPYSVTLTHKEWTALPWFVCRGYFPESVFQAMALDDTDSFNSVADSCEFRLTEPEAWELHEFIEDHEWTFPCMSETLASKFRDLVSNVV